MKKATCFPAHSSCEIIAERTGEHVTGHQYG
jgi:hypothetical protein